MPSCSAWSRGVTEFLPISSTGHLIVVNELLGLESEVQLKDKAGNPLWYKKPSEKHPAGVPLTLKLAADTYTVVIQVGAIAAVVFLYWQQLFMMLGGLLGRSSAGLRLLRNVCYAVLPVGIIGLLLHDLIDQYLFYVWAVIAARLPAPFSCSGPSAGATPTPESAGPRAMPRICRRARRSASASRSVWHSGRAPADRWSPSSAVIWPDSRPPRPRNSASSSACPTLAGAALLKSVKSGPAMIEVFGWTNVLLGTVVAAISALIAVKLFVHIISRYRPRVFRLVPAHSGLGFGGRFLPHLTPDAGFRYIA